MSAFWSRQDDALVLPDGYELRDSDPDVIAVVNPGGKEIARFSPGGATRREIELAAWRDADSQASDRSHQDTPRTGRPGGKDWW